MVFSPAAVTETSDILLVLINEFLNIQATTECGFTLKRMHDMIKTYSQIYRTDKYSQHGSIIWPVWLNGWVFVYKLNGWGLQSRCSHLHLWYPSCLINEFLKIQAITECGFTLKRIHDMIKAHSKMYRTDKYSQRSSTIWPVWINRWAFWYSDNYRCMNSLWNMYVTW